MKPLSALSAATLVALPLIACNQPADTHDADVKAIQDTEAQWNQDYASRDADKVVAHYTDDATLMVAGTPPSTGKDAIRKVLTTEMFPDPNLSLKFQSSRVEVAKSGDLAYTQGTYTLTLTDPQTRQLIHDHGSYVTTYRKQPDGSWKALADSVTSELPPPAPPAASTKKP